MELFDGEFNQLFDVDWLRASGETPHWFGLGFIQLKLNADCRLHFWHPELTADTPEEELHDHRYTFHSRILVGKIVHEEWFLEKDENGDHEQVLVSCKPGVEADPTPVARGRLVRGSTYTLCAGSEYTFTETGFHRIRADRAVTYLERGPVTKEFANVIRPLGAPSVCPFSRTVPQDRLWECIADLLQEAGSKPGYHLRNIPKGELGEPSKIVEEVFEFLDATEQDCDVMALVELADLHGAISAWLKKRHPSLTVADLAKMSNITERAFRNGRR